MGPMTQLRLVLVTSVTFWFKINMTNNGGIHQPKRTGVHSETQKHAWFFSADIPYTLAFRNGRNKDQEPVTSRQTDSVSASCHVWFCHDSEVKNLFQFYLISHQAINPSGAVLCDNDIDTITMTYWLDNVMWWRLYMMISMHCHVNKSARVSAQFSYVRLESFVSV